MSENPDSAAGSSHGDAGPGAGDPNPDLDLFSATARVQPEQSEPETDSRPLETDESSEEDPVDQQRQPLAPAKLRADYLGHTIQTAVFAIIGLVFGVVQIVSEPSAFRLAVIGGGGLALLVLYKLGTDAFARASYRRYSYRVDESGLEIRRGVLWHSVINIPRSRVQHTDVSRGPLERFFGIASLSIHTAGTSNATVLLPGLEARRALWIRNHLLGSDEEYDAV